MVEEINENKDKETTKTETGGSKPGALASAARQVSRGSLLGGGESKQSMASTVLAMASKATTSSTQKESKENKEPAAKETKPPPPPPPPKPSTSGTKPSTAPPPKPEPPVVNSSRRARHDSQGEFNIQCYFLPSFSSICFI